MSAPWNHHTAQFVNGPRCEGVGTHTLICGCVCSELLQMGGHTVRWNDWPENSRSRDVPPKKQTRQRRKARRAAVGPAVVAVTKLSFLVVVKDRSFRASFCARLSQEYRNLSEDEFQHFQEVGRAATLASRMGAWPARLILGCALQLMVTTSYG